MNSPCPPRSQASPAQGHVTRFRAEAAQRLRDLLRVPVITGAFGDGPLPTEADLMLEHAVSRNVVRDALSMLRDEGLIERVRGAGTFVMAGKARHHIGQLHGILDTLGAEARGGENRILSVESTRAVPIVAERLGLEPGSRCDVVEYLTLVDGETLVGGTSYLPAPLGHRLPGGDFSVDYYHLLESVGIELSRSEAIIEAVVADETLGRLMGVRRGAPLVLFERTMYLRTGEPVEFGFHRVRGDRVALVIEQRRCRKEG